MIAFEHYKRAIWILQNRTIVILKIFIYLHALNSNIKDMVTSCLFTFQGNFWLYRISKLARYSNNLFLKTRLSFLLCTAAIVKMASQINNGRFEVACWHRYTQRYLSNLYGVFLFSESRNCDTKMLQKQKIDCLVIFSTFHF